MSDVIQTNAIKDVMKKGFDLNLLINCMENMRQSNENLEKNILNELKQIGEVMADMRNAIHELPIRFADALTQCLDSVNSRSDSLSVDSESQMVHILDKMDVNINDNDIEDYSFVDLSDKTNSSETQTLDSKTITTDNKFVFPYDSTLDLNKWLKRD